MRSGSGRSLSRGVLALRRPERRSSPRSPWCRSGSGSCPPRCRASTGPAAGWSCCCTSPTSPSRARPASLYRATKPLVAPLLLILLLLLVAEHRRTTARTPDGVRGGVRHVARDESPRPAGPLLRARAARGAGRRLAPDAAGLRHGARACRRGPGVLLLQRPARALVDPLPERLLARPQLPAAEPAMAAGPWAVGRRRTIAGRLDARADRWPPARPAAGGGSRCRGGLVLARAQPPAAHRLRPGCRGSGSDRAGGDGRDDGGTLPDRHVDRPSLLVLPAALPGTARRRRCCGHSSVWRSRADRCPASFRSCSRRSSSRTSSSGRSAGS